MIDQNRIRSPASPARSRTNPRSALRLVARDDVSAAHAAADRNGALPGSQDVDDMADGLRGLLLHTFPALLRQPLATAKHGHCKVLGRRIEERLLLGLIKCPGTLGHGL